MSDAEPVCGLFDLRDLVGSTANRFARAAEEKGLWLELKLADSLPGKVIGDALALEQVLSALIDNAVRYTESGEIVASATCEEATGGRVLFRFELSDTGVGIPGETLERLFDSSRRPLPPTLPASDDGGLIRSRWLVDLMDGGFGCSSEIAMGTTVWLTVPLDLPDA